MIKTRPNTSTSVLGVVVLLLIAGALVLAFKPKTVDEAPVTSSTTTCEPRTEQQNTDRADLIVTGAVFAVIPGPTGADVLITVDQVIKGTVPKTGITIAALEATTTPGTGSNTPSGELHFSADDQPYLLFLHERTDGRYDTSVCDGSRIIKQGDQMITLSFAFDRLLG